MSRGPRVLSFAVLVTLWSSWAPAQTTSLLRVSVVLQDAAQKPVPVPRHVLLVSDNPATGLPKRMVTSANGTAELKLRPGNYTVESDRPVAFEGQGYQWTALVDIAAGADASLELTSANAEVVPVAGATTMTGSSTADPAAATNDPSFLLPAWQGSVAGIWTPTARATGFLVDDRGLIVTSRQAVGEAPTVEVQRSPTNKMAGHVLLSDAVRDVAVVWVDASMFAGAKPVPLACDRAATATFSDRQELLTLVSPLRGTTTLADGVVTVLRGRSVDADFRLPTGGVGGPVFGQAGTLVGLTTLAAEPEDRRRRDVPVIRLDAICDAVAAARKKLTTASPPGTIQLPVEPSSPFPAAPPDQGDGVRTGPLAYELTASDFEVAFITPPLVRRAQQRTGWTGGATSRSEEAEARLGSLTDFGDWTAYFADTPPVLIVRVTPKLAEGFWKMLARGAARTQGIALPPLRSFKPGFLRLRATCGEVELIPIHPFVLEQRVGDGDAIREGLYVFDPEAIGPQCGTVKLTLYSEKTPQRGDTKTVDARIVEQIWKDFEPWRQAAGQR